MTISVHHHDFSIPEIPKPPARKHDHWKVGLCGVHVFEDRDEARRPCAFCAAVLADARGIPMRGRYVENEVRSKNAMGREAHPTSKAFLSRAIAAHVGEKAEAKAENAKVAEELAAE